MPGRLPLAFALSVALVAGVAFFSHEDEPHAHALAGIHKIRHVVVIMQENRSFDSYFGTYPGADGLPRRNGRFTVCFARSPQRDLLLPVPRHAQPQQRRPARAPRRGPRHQRREDERLRARGQAGAGDRLRRQPGRAGVLVRRGAPGRDGLPRRARDPELLVLRAPLRAARTTCFSRTPRGACRRTCSWSRNGRPAAGRTRRRAASTRSRTRWPRRTSRRTRPAASRSTPGPTSPTCCTRTASPGGTSSSRVRSPTATTVAWPASRSSKTRAHPGSGTRCPGSTRSGPTTSCATSFR